MSKTLIVIDMQNDFVDENVLGNKECKSVIPKIVEKMNNNKYDNIIFTQDTHQSNYLETQEGKKLPVPHCIENTPGWEVVDILKTTAANVTDNISYITKNTFGSIDLPNMINTDEIHIVGVCTGICVISNTLLLKAHFPEKTIVVDSNCCACVTPQSHQTALEAMKMCQIDVI